MAENGPVPVVESVPVMVKLKVPPAVGTPEMMPVAIERNAGRQCAAADREAVGRGAPGEPNRGVITDAGLGGRQTARAEHQGWLRDGEGVRLRVEVYGPVPVLESVTEAVKWNVPAAVGVPLMVPVVPSSNKPAGRAPLTMVMFE